MKTLFLLLLAFSCVSCQCQKGFVNHDQSCYALIRVRSTWAEAVTYCHAIVSELATVTTDSEHKFITDWMVRESAGISPEGVWLGGQDYLLEGDWMWAFQGGDFSKTWWGPGSPDNYHQDQHCLSLWKAEGFGWNDDYCHEKLYFICETEASTDPAIG